MKIKLMIASMVVCLATSLAQADDGGVRFSEKIMEKNNQRKAKSALKTATQPLKELKNVEKPALK